jgi:hypothetical protein
MNTADINSKLIDSYLSLLKNMSVENKLDLISKLTKTVKTEIEQDQPDFYKSFGGWDKNESAEDLISTINGARNINRKLDEF